MRGVNPHHGGYLGDNFTPETLTEEGSKKVGIGRRFFLDKKRLESGLLVRFS